MSFVLKSRYIQFICLMILAIDLTSARIQIGDGLPSGYTYHDEIKTSYKLFTTELSWSHARLACLNDGGRLAVIDTSQKIGCISNQIQFGHHVWVGIMREGLWSPWVDVDGGPLPAHLPWGLIDGIPFGNCAALSGVTGSLTNKYCSMRKMYVCEILGERRSASNWVGQNY